MRKKVLAVSVVVLVAAGVIGGYQVYQKKINNGMGITEQWASNQFRVVSEMPGMSARIGNRSELERYIRTLGVWDGFRVDGGESVGRILPKRIVIHLTYDEYKDTWYRDQAGGHLYSGRAEADADEETLHIYLGFDEETFGGDPERLARAADIILFETMYYRTSLGRYDQRGVEMREAKRQTEPFFVISKTRGAE